MTSVEQWVPGLVHPTGDYDDVVHTDHVSTYTRDGKLHRLDGPAVMTGASEDSGEIEQWYVDGVAHREDGPADTRWHGEHARTEVWLSRGLPSRADGPAYTEFDAEGEVQREIFYLLGRKVTAEEHARALEAIESGAPEEWAFAYAYGQAM